MPKKLSAAALSTQLPFFKVLRRPIEFTIINNGIVMIDRIDQGRKELAVDEAVIGAAGARARPIVMTTITTAVGLMPLALFGGEFWFGMAIVIMSGLAVGTILTLGFVPVLYSLMFRGGAAPE